MAKIKWNRVTTRGKNFPVLLIGLVAWSFKKNSTAKFYNLPTPVHYRQFNNSRWFSDEYIKTIISKLDKISESNPDKIFKLAKRYQKSLSEAKIWSNKYRKKHFKSFNNKQLINVWQKFFNESSKIFGAVYFYIFINKFLPDKITQIIAQKEKNFTTQNEYLKTLFNLGRSSETRKEKESILKMAEDVKEAKVKLGDKRLNKKIESHLKKFAYLGKYYYWRAPYSRNDVTKRIKNLIRKNLDKEFKGLNELKKSSVGSKRIMVKLNFNEKEIIFVKSAKEWSFSGNNFDETYTNIIFNLGELFKETSVRLGIKYFELIEMTPDEIIDSLERDGINENLKNILEERIIENAIILIKRKIKVISGKELKKYYREELKEDSKIGKFKEFKGQPASPGKVKGKVHIVWEIAEAAKVKRGEILVAPATTPAHVPAMEKAAAIVTDEGGLLSHAAIVSRELGVPCVVGAKIATKVLRDGDLVEVDAAKGVVKKLS